MKDLTLIYYTANLVGESFSERVRGHLLSLFPEGIPIVSVSHKPMHFGLNICVAGFEVSIYNIYKQILIGSRLAQTRYVAMCEDDSLYTREHFEHRPADDSFDYNSNRWHIYKSIYFHRPRPGMHTCIAPRKLMIETLEKRFEKFPKLLDEKKGELVGFAEPGRSERRLGLPIVKLTTFNSPTPVLVFDHKGSLGGVRKVKATDHIEKSLDGWGSAQELWDRMVHE